MAKISQPPRQEQSADAPGQGVTRSRADPAFDALLREAAHVSLTCHGSALALQALVGRLPFEGTTGEIIAAKQRDVAHSPRAIDPWVPADLSDLRARLLARDPAERPTLAALRDASEGERVATALSVCTLHGRESELAQLHEAYRATLSGTGVVVCIAGESGLGKSALCQAAS